MGVGMRKSKRSWVRELESGERDGLVRIAVLLLVIVVVLIARAAGVMPA